jgi:two-component system, response regulator
VTDGYPARLPVGGGPLDVLLVQDNPLEVELLLRPLRQLAGNCRVGVARDGEEALDYLLGRGPFRQRLGAPPPRLILVDLKLPKMDGVDVLRAVRGSPRTSSAVVVILTPSDEPRELAQCYQAGANSCVQKPLDFAAFSETILTLGRYWLSVNQPPPVTSVPGTRGSGGVTGAAGRRAGGAASE